MKSLEILFVCLFVFGFNHNVDAQTDDVKLASILQIYATEAKPYLLKFAQAKYGEKSDELTKTAIEAKYNALIAKTDKIGLDVTKILSQVEKGKTDKTYISTLISHQYETNFPGLPREYWELVKKRVLNL
ncbi:MAG: hypothetical protein ING84_18075 [Cytophagales bacterium]|nr:hypothetical protein [Cytophagales bacterium]